VAKTTTYVLAPTYSSDVLLAPMFSNAVGVAIWMLVKGVHWERWERAGRSSLLQWVAAASAMGQPERARRQHRVLHVSNFHPEPRHRAFNHRPFCVSIHPRRRLDGLSQAQFVPERRLA
jgi:hypothetical protein